jgi:DNA-directed RNA polymerase specialized sigma24 family protein
VTRAEEFEELRSLLFAIAYRILGSVSEAEDAVQETWLRYQASATRPTSTKAFLSAVVTRISIDVLRSARFRQESSEPGEQRPRRSDMSASDPRHITSQVIERRLRSYDHSGAKTIRLGRRRTR